MVVKSPPPRYLNKTFLKGRLGKNPEYRTLPSGAPVCHFSLATRSGPHVEWHKVVAYDDWADYINAAFGSGDFVYIEAEIRTREFQTEDDKVRNRKPRKVLELIVREAHLLKKNGGGEDTGEEEILPMDSDGLRDSDSALMSRDSGSEIPSYL